MAATKENPMCRLVKTADKAEAATMQHRHHHYQWRTLSGLFFSAICLLHAVLQFRVSTYIQLNK